MKTNYTLSIPKPCHEDWSKMAPNEKGRFCQSCSKTVVDFTQMNVDEIQDYIHNNRSQRICGHIKQNQLYTINLKVPETVFNQNLSFHKLFLLTLLLVMGTSLMNCEDDKGRTQKIHSIEIVERTLDSSSKKEIQSTDTISKTNIKRIDSSKVKNIDPPIPVIMGDMIEVEGMIEINYKEPYAYNYVDEKPKFLNTPSNLSGEEERKYFHKEITKIIKKEFDTLVGKKANLKGKQRIYVNFEINTSGDIDKVKTKAQYPKLEDEAKRVFKLFPRFIPAKHKGNIVSTVYTLPIVFVIED